MARAAVSRWWWAVAAVGLAQAVVFAVVAAVDDLGILGQAAIALGAAVLAARGWIVGVLVVGALSLLEAVFVPFYDRETTFDAITQGTLWFLGVLGLVAVAGLLLERRRVAGQPK